MKKRATGNPPRPFRFSVQVSDLIADTQYLDAAQFGAYMRLLFAYWRTGAPRDDDRLLARIVGMSPVEWASVRPMLEPFFDVLDGHWIHWRTDEDLAAAYEAINKASRAGKAAAQARWGKARGSGRNAADGTNRSTGRTADGDAIALRNACGSHGHAVALPSHCDSQLQQEYMGTAPYDPRPSQGKDGSAGAPPHMGAGVSHEDEPTPPDWLGHGAHSEVRAREAGELPHFLLDDERGAA